MAGERGRRKTGRIQGILTMKAAGSGGGDENRVVWHGRLYRTLLYVQSKTAKFWQLCMHNFLVVPCAFGSDLPF